MAPSLANWHTLAGLQDINTHWLVSVQMITRSQAAKMSDIENIDAPQIAIDYYGLRLDAKLSDVVKKVREDEQGHADVNHLMADELK